MKDPVTTLAIPRDVKLYTLPGKPEPIQFLNQAAAVLDRHAAERAIRERSRLTAAETVSRAVARRRS